MPSQLTQDGMFITLREIAAWQLPEVAQLAPDKSVALPALQRGAVWKPHQVECLWDSLVRGFPIGACLLAPFERSRGTQLFKFQQQQPAVQNHNPEFHLLDGQQRANAIALGFLNPWDPMRSQATAVLWVDIAPQPDDANTRFLFRVITRSHPWGYKRDNAAQRITNKQMHEALEAFCLASPNLKNSRPAEIPLKYAWPYDSAAPIPLALLLEAVQESDCIAALRRRLQQMPLFNIALPERKGWDWARNIGAALDRADSRLVDHFSELCYGLKACLQASIPALVLRPPRDTKNSSNNQPSRDPVETLFVRVNTQGTTLDGEELIYSLLKSAWPEAQECVQELQFKVVPASRLVLLSTRLVLACSSEYKETLPPIPSVSGFRRLLRCDNLEDRMQQFIRNRGYHIFKTAKDMLESGEYGLPVVLSCGIARSRPDVLLLLLRWVDRMLAAGKNPCSMSSRDKRRIIGMVTAFAWFAVDPTRCASLVWKRLQACAAEELDSFFSHSTFMLTLKLGDQDYVPMLPLVSPDVLSAFINTQVTNFDADGSCWTAAWNWSERMQPNQLPEKLVEWYSSSFANYWDRPPREDGSKFDLLPAISRSWRDLIGRLKDWHRRQDLLLYAQRGLIREHFPDYDPSMPDQMEDINCPWDYDHVHPQSYVARKWEIPQIIKDWHSTMGNFRAWPFDINRADGDDIPQAKFGNVSIMERERYGLSSPEQKRQLSFIDDNLDWKYWQASAPHDCREGRYLSRATSATYRQALIRGITTRFVAIYREWYDNVGIADLMPSNGNSRQIPTTVS